MSTQTANSGNVAGLNDYWLARRDQLFLASCISLIVTAMSFAIRGALIDPLGKQFDISNANMGIIAGTAFWGFALATIIGGLLCDIVGMGRLLTLSFIGHTIGILLTIMATGFWSLFLGTLAFGLANGCVEAACNPLIATLYPDQKIKRLGLFHAWFPGGIVIGGLAAWIITKLNIGVDPAGGMGYGWKIQMATMILPLIIYGFLFLGKKFPKTEREASGVSMSNMFQETLRPLYIIFVACMILTAATELVTGTWLTSILGATTGLYGNAILLLVWISGLMAVGRMFAGPIVHRISPVVLLITSAVFSAIGLFLLSRADSAVSGAFAATLFAFGVCFFWPTMLGVASERFPKTGALGLSVMGGLGMLSVAIFLPIVGGRVDEGIKAALPSGTTLEALQLAAAKSTTAADQLAAAQAAGGRAGMSFMVYLPIILIFAFLAVYLYDRSRGGYRQETLIQDQLTPTEIGEALSPVNQA